METRWFRRLGPGVAALGAVAAIASSTAGAPPASWRPPACPGPPVLTSGAIGTWYRLDPTLADGTYVGQRLSVGAGIDTGTSTRPRARIVRDRPVGGHRAHRVRRWAPLATLADRCRGWLRLVPRLIDGRDTERRAGRRTAARSSRAASTGERGRTSASGGDRWTGAVPPGSSRRSPPMTGSARRG